MFFRAPLWLSTGLAAVELTDIGLRETESNSARLETAGESLELL